MAQISEHLNVRPFQVAVSTDETLIYRKWDHKGTCWSVDHTDAAIKFGKGKLISRYHNHNSKYGATFQFEHNFVHVGFGS